VIEARRANRRIRLLALLFAGAFAVTLARAMWIQGVQAGSLHRMAAHQQTEIVTIPATRGSIFDVNGVELAVGRQRTTLYADPTQVTRPGAIARAAHRLLHVKRGPLMEALAKHGSSFAYIARAADPIAAQAFLKLKLPGVYSYPEEQRSYPERSVAAQVLGYAGIDNKGLQGLELGYDKALSGKPGVQTIVKAPGGQAIDVLSSRPERDGRNLVLTLDRSIQQNAEQVLLQTIHRWHASAATAVVLDPRTGAVLAMASVPGYDANATPKTWAALQRNRAVTDTYEPGSTFKLVTVAGALAEHVVTPQEKFTLKYSIHVADKVIHDAERRPTERLSVAQILSHSSNVGAITLSRLLGAKSLSRWIEAFGFGKPTGIDFPGESAGIVASVDHWYGSSAGDIPIGQGISVTPIQMAAAYAAIANGGVWEQPHIVDHVGDVPAPHRVHRRVVSAAVAHEMMQMLRGVVDEAVGTGTLARVPGYHVAGKTGTAAKPEHGGYSRSDYVASFIGAVPASDPKLLILVSVDSPHGSIWGGVVAAPAFSDIARFDLQYLEILPDAPGSSD
jgi:cell division protein FtsI (penicillin-binding protein 3)